MGKEIDVKQCLQTIDDLITVEDKLITYRGLSKVLKVHTDQAKDLLSSYVDEAKKKSKFDELAVVYLVGGPVKDAESVTRFTLIPSDKLENEKQKFATLDAEHVYSVCRGRKVTQADVYNAAKSVTELEKEFSSIRCNDEDVKKRPRERTIPPPPAPSTSSKTVKEDKPAPKKEVEASKPAKKSPQEKKKASPKKKDAPIPKGGGINAMFKRQVEKKKEEEQNVAKPKPEKSQVVAETAVAEDEKKSSKPKKKTKAAASKTKAKKLRRIRVMSDSESGNSSGSEEEEKDEEKEDELRRMNVDDVVEPSDEVVKAAESDEEIIPATPVDESKKGRKRVRKQVDKSFIDDDGYLCVKKEYVFESCSDDEGVSPAKSPKVDSTTEAKEKATTPAGTSSSKPKDKMETVEAKPKKGKKNMSPQKSKQASIMNFFKKV